MKDKLIEEKLKAQYVLSYGKNWNEKLWLKDNFKAELQRIKKEMKK